MPHDTVTDITLAEVKRRITTGSRWRVTNYYMPEDYWLHGPHDRTVVAATSKAFFLSLPGRDDESRVEWPKASQVRADGDAILLFGGGAGQPNDDLFLRLEPLDD